MSEVDGLVIRRHSEIMLLVNGGKQLHAYSTSASEK